MKKPSQQFTPKSQSSSQFFNRLCSRLSPTNRKPLNNMLNAPIATSRQNRSRSIRQALDSIKKRSISKDQALLRRLLPSVRSVEKYPQRALEKSPNCRPFANITGSFLNKTVNGFSKIKPIREGLTKDTFRLQSRLQSNETSLQEFMLKSSIIHMPEPNKELTNKKSQDKLLEEILFGNTSQSSSYIIQDSVGLQQSRRGQQKQLSKRSESLLLQDVGNSGCTCGCKVFRYMVNSQATNKLKKRLAKIPTQFIFDYIYKQCRNRSSIGFSELKQLLSRFMMCNNLAYRYEDLYSMLQQLYDMSSQISSGICFRKIGKYLSTFTDSDRNRIRCIWDAIKRDFISVGEIKVTIMQSHTRSFYEDVRDAFNRSGFKDDEEICYWDLYIIRDTFEVTRLIELLWQSSLMGTEFRISHTVPEKLLVTM